MKLNEQAYEQAKKLIREGNVRLDERDAWSEHKPSTEEENRFIQEHGFGEYSKWFLGIDTGKREGQKGRYTFPYGDFENIHRCGVLAAEVRAGQYKYPDIEFAAAHLHGELDALREHAKK